MIVREQAATWIKGLAERQRRPLKTSTLRTYQHLLNRWVLPTLGTLELEAVTNRTLRDLVTEMRQHGRSTVTIQAVILIIREVIRSDRDPDSGEQKVKFAFNPDFVDVPILDKRKQKAPTVTQKAIQEAICEAWAPRRQYSLLYALLAGGGLRVSEALAIRVGRTEAVTYWDPEERLIHVQTQVYRGVETSPKSSAGYRDVDLCKELNDFLVAGALALGRQHKERLFDIGADRERYVLSRTKIRGFHSFRRFRATHLRVAQAPEDLIRYWLGHSSNQITDRYSKLAERIDVRKEWTEKVGLGFKLQVEENSNG